MTPYTQFDTDLAACRKCELLLARVAVDPSVSSECVKPRPIITGIRKKPVMLIGQTPGIKEYESGEPFKGSAGQKIRDIFQQAGINDFSNQVFSSAVAKCYAGRKFRKKNDPTSKVEDCVPSSQMISNCRPFLERQFLLVEPLVVVTLGGLALKTYLSLSGQSTGDVRLEQFVGTSQEWQGRSIVFFPHTSGGARWLNDQENRALFEKAQILLKQIFIQRGIASGA